MMAIHVWWNPIVMVFLLPETKHSVVIKFLGVVLRVLCRVGT